MKFLTPEIEALARDVKSKSLINQSASCGIFQNCDSNQNSSIKTQSSAINK